MLEITAKIELITADPEFKTEQDQIRYVYQINDWKLVDRVFTFYHYSTPYMRDKKNPNNERKRIAKSLRSKHSALWHHYDLVKNPPT